MAQALILAAGEGKRLRPLTNDVPKCLVNFMNKSLLERQVKTLKKAGISKIHISTGYKAEKIKSLGFDTSLNKKYSQTNMVESLFSAIKFIESCNEDLIISYGDIIYHTSNLRALLESKDDVSIMVDKDWYKLWSLRIENPLEDAETLVLDSDNYILELGKKPKNYQKIQGQYTGLIKIKAEKIKEIISFYKNIERDLIYDGQNFYNMYMTTFIQLLINAGWGVKAILVSNGWLEIDSVEDLRIYEKLQKIGKLSEIYNLDD